MARRVFFSFHYERDIFRVMQVRNSWIIPGVEEAGFIDQAAFEQVRRRGEAAVERWIDDQLHNTSVTVVLIGTETASRPYVGYEIKQSHVRGNGILGVYIHNLKTPQAGADYQGPNPLANWHIQQNGQTVLLSSLYPTYDYVKDNGYQNMGIWIERAAQRAGR